MRPLSLLAALLGVVLILSCQPEMASQHLPDQFKMLVRMKVLVGTDFVVHDVAPGRDSCSAAASCASTNGSRPSCTKPYEGDVECVESGEEYSWHAIVACGELPCVNVTLAEAYDAVDNGDGCPCDGVTLHGEPAVLAKTSCDAPATTIDARDAEDGLEKFVAI